MTPRHDKLIIALTAVALTLVCYGHSLRTPLLWDDMDVVTPAGRRLTMSDIPSYFRRAHWLTIEEAGPRPYRPLRDSYLAVMADLSAANDWPFHAGNLALHALNVFLLFMLVGRISGSRLTAYIASALFAAHPIHTEAVVWTKNAAELLALALALGAAIFYIRAVEAPGENDDEPIGRSVIRSFGEKPGDYIPAVLLYVAALLAKESALPLPGLLVVWAFMYLRGRRMARAITLTAPMWLAGFAYTGFQYVFLADRAAPAAAPAGIGTRLMLGARTLAEYLRMMFFPTFNRPLVEFAPTGGVGAGTTALLILLFGLCAALFVVCLWKRRRMTFGLWWAMLALGPVSNIIKFNTMRPIAEQRVYLPSAGVALFIAMAASRLISRAGKLERKAAIAAVSLTLISFTILSASAAPRWRSKLDFWRWTARAAPDMFPPPLNLGIKYARAADEIDEPGVEYFERMARASYEHALWIHPWNPDIALNMGNSFARTNQNENAARFYRWSIAADPGYAAGRFNLGRAYFILGLSENAEEQLRLAMQLDAAYAPRAARTIAQIYLGREEPAGALEATLEGLKIAGPHPVLDRLAGDLLRDMGGFAESARHLKRALEAEGESAELRALLGRTLLAAGDFRAAEQSIRIALSFDPRHTDANAALGTLLLRTGRPGEAREYLARALESAPDDAEALIGMAGVMQSVGREGDAAGYYERALEHQPDDRTALVNLGAILSRRDESRERGVELLERAHELAPREIGIMKILSDAYIRADRAEDAAELLRRARDIAPDNRDIIRMLDEIDEGI